MAKMRTAWSCEHVTASSVMVDLSQYLFVTSLNSLWRRVCLLMESFVLRHLHSGVHGVGSHICCIVLSGMGVKMFKSWASYLLLIPKNIRTLMIHVALRDESGHVCYSARLSTALTVYGV
jgi:hypothetical protein